MPGCPTCRADDCCFDGACTKTEGLYAVRVVENRTGDETGIIGPFASEEAALAWADRQAVVPDTGNPPLPSGRGLYTYHVEPLTKPY